MGQWPTFRGPVILTYLEDVLMEECWTEDIQCDIKFDLQLYM